MATSLTDKTAEADKMEKSKAKEKEEMETAGATAGAALQPTKECSPAAPRLSHACCHHQP